MAPVIPASEAVPSAPPLMQERVVYPSLPAQLPAGYYHQLPPQPESIYGRWGAPGDGAVSMPLPPPPTYIVHPSAPPMDPLPPLPPPPPDAAALAKLVRSRATAAADLAMHDCTRVPAEAWAARGAAADLSALGVTWEHLVAAGVRREHVRALGASALAEHTGLTIAKLVPLLDAKHALAQLRVVAPTFNDLYALGASVAEMRKLGLTKLDLDAFKQTAAQWALLGMTAHQIRELNLGKEDVRRLQWTTADMRQHMKLDDDALARLGRAFCF